VLFSAPCQYAIRAMAYLSVQDQGRLCSIQEIAEKADVPNSFLAKVISQLSRARLIVARRGPGGGVKLSRPSEEILVWEVVEAIEGPRGPKACILGLSECSADAPCPMHDEWQVLDAQIDESLHNQRVSELGEAWLAKIRRRKSK